MQQVGQMHLMRTGEPGDDTTGEVRAVLAFALLGELVVAMLIVAGLALLAIAAVGLLARSHQGMHAGTVVAALLALAPLWLAVHLMRLLGAQPPGYPIERAEAPELFRAISRARRALKAPKPAAVLVDERFAVTLVSQPRWGLGLLGHRHTLVLGWPMLCALEPRRLIAAVTQELAHARAHGGAVARVHRSRLAWHGVQRQLQGRRGTAAALIRRLLGWYLPRLDERAHALAWQEDHEADRLAAKLCSVDVVGQAWNEIEIKSRWYAERHWREVWRRAARQERPEPMPHADMKRRLRKPPDDGFAQEALRLALQRLPDTAAEHPAMRERLAALGAMPGLPDWSRRGAVQLLGSTATRIAAQFDERWWNEQRREWARLRTQQQRCLERIQALKVRAAQLSGDEWVDWADCFEALSSDDSSVLYEHALHRDPQHAGALRRLAECRAASVHPDAMSVFERLASTHPQHAFAASELALQWLDRREHAGHEVGVELRRRWQAERQRLAALEQQAREQFQAGRPHEQTSVPQCTDAERRQIVDALIRTPQVKAAWLLGKQVPAMPTRAYLVLVVEPARADERLARRLRAQLLAALPFDGRLRVAVLGAELREQELDHSPAASIYRRQGQ
jgi:hypothetical protein